MKAVKRSHRLLAEAHLIDIARLNPRLDPQIVAIGHDQHQRFALRSDHAADRVNRQLVHKAGLRRADVDAPELIVGGDPALAQFRNPGANFAEVLADLRLQVAIDLQNSATRSR